MLVIDKDTERKLHQDLKHGWQTSPSHRCLYLRFSLVVHEKEEWFGAALRILREILDDASAQLYICHDNDIFIITRSITQKHVHDFFTKFVHVLTPAPTPEIATLFEIGVDWPKIRPICEKKIEHVALLNNQKKKNKKTELEKISQEQTLDTLDKALIDSIDKRRAERDTPEIMVVEDDLFSQKLVGNALKSTYSLSIISDGQGALMNYVAKAPDVLFLDIGLPDMNGHEVLEKLFKFDPKAYVVMFSGNGDKDNILKAVDLGAQGFIGKPFTKDKLVQYIQKSPFIQKKMHKETEHETFV